MAGYSGTPLPKKLGIKDGSRVALAAAPKDFAATLGPLPAGARTLDARRAKPPFDAILFFATERAALAANFADLAARLTPSGGLWIAWPKKAAKLATDLSENVVRAVGLEAGLVDNKVCAIDETWSGLRFVVRLADRGRRPCRRVNDSGPSPA